jgi:hypothetical protein
MGSSVAWSSLQYDGDVRANEVHCGLDKAQAVQQLFLKSAAMDGRFLILFCAQG